MKISRSRIGSVHARLLSRTRLLVLTGILSALFPQTAPGVVTNPGVPVDFSDLTEEKLNWRKNRLTYSEQLDNAAWSKTQVGIAGLPVLTPAYSAAPDGTMTAQRLQMTLNGSTSLADYCTLHQFYSAQIGRTFSHGVWLKTNDGTSKVLIYRDDNAQTVNKPITVTPVWQRFSAENGVAVTASLNACRLWLRGAQGTADSVDLSIWGAQLNDGPVLLDYQRITDVSTEFLAAFPAHLLYRDSFGQVACYQLEDPLGRALDPRFAGQRGAELALDGGFSGTAAWASGNGWSVSGGKARFETAGSAANLTQTMDLAENKTYEVSFDVDAITAGAVFVRINGTGSTDGPSQAVKGKYRTYIRAGAVPVSVAIRSNSATTGLVVDNFTIKEVYGVNVTQPTTGDRPIISAKYNLLANSAWQGGGAIPTGWTQPVAAATTASPGVDGNVIYRFPAVAGRAFFAAPLVSLAVGQTMALGTTVESIASGAASVQEVVVSAPSSGGGTNAFYVDGVLVSAATPVVVGQRVVCITTCTSAGTFIPRVGAGCSGNVTVDVSLSRPMLSLGNVADVPRYQRVNADGTYDYAGFPIGARFNGINSSMRVESVDGTAHTKAIIGASLRKESDAALAIPFEFTTSYNANVGGCVVFAPVGAPNSPDYAVGINSGSVSVRASPLTYPAPRTAVIASPLDMRGVNTQDRVEPVINGTTEGNRTASTGVQGSANFAAGESFIGVRSTGGGRYTGMIYRVFLRFGDNEGSNVALVIRWLNERLKASF